MDLRLLILTLLAALAAAACSTSTPSQRPGTHKKYTIRVGSTERSYLLFLPSDYESDSSSRPLILSYHGGGRDAEQQLDLDQFTNPFFNKKALVAYPQGINVSPHTTPFPS
jgi:poly(3-hydroxybutyrate) depolymerase